MGLGWWSAPSPDLELALDGIKPLHPLPLETLEALDAQAAPLREQFLERYEESLKAVVKDDFFQQALELHSELQGEGETHRDRAKIREAVADKIWYEVFPHAVRDRGFEDAKVWLQRAQKLNDARRFGVWGVDPHEGKAKCLWSNRAGINKLCPDDGRNEANRVAELYGERLDMCNEGGYVLRFAVFTLPNFPRHHLSAGIAEIKRQFREKITHALYNGAVLDRDRRGRKRLRTVARNMRDPDRLFRDLVGFIACIEAPLSGLYAEDQSNAWNVHLNAILVFKQSKDQPYGRPDYKPLREAWGSNVEFLSIPQGDKDATAAAVRECVKYPLQAVSEKSAKHRKLKRDRFGRVLPPAPPLLEWPPEYIDEWYRAFEGVRRAWSGGLLYSRKMRFTDELVIELPKPPKRDPNKWDFLGTMRCSSTEFYVSPPRRDFRELEREKRRVAFVHRARLSTEPEYAEAYEAKTARRELRSQHLRRRNEAELAWFAWIQGNKSAQKSSVTTNEGFRAARGPP